MDIYTAELEASYCTACELHKNREKAVFSRGNTTAPIMICGMVPAHEENKVGKPFVGRAGKLLDNIIKESGIDDVYITNIVKCCLAPGISLKKDWIDSCIPYLLVQIAHIQPKVILTLGGDASNGLLGTVGVPMKDLIGKVFDYSANTKVVPTYHPSYLLRGGGVKHKAYSSVVQTFSEANDF